MKKHIGRLSLGIVVFMAYNFSFNVTTDVLNKFEKSNVKPKQKNKVIDWQNVGNRNYIELNKK